MLIGEASLLGLRFEKFMRNISLFLFIILLIASCRQSDFEINNLNNNNIAVLGHGGMGIASTYPLNSFESIQNCLSLGADGTEIDVQMTLDGVLVAFHAELLEHSTALSGRIYEKTWDEIKEATYSEPPYTNYKVITLDELFTNIQTPKASTFFLDCKNFNPDNSSSYIITFTEALIEFIDKHGIADNVYIELKRHELIESLHMERPDLKIFVYKAFEEALSIVNEFQLDGITISIADISESQIKKAHSEGVQIAVFNTHSNKRNLEAIEKNVDFIQTDKLKHLLKLLK